MTRFMRKGAGATAIAWLKKAAAAVFYRLTRNLGDVALPQNVGDFRLMSRRVVDALQQLRERHRFMKGLFAWVGFPSTVVVYHHEARGAGRSKWSLWKLWNFALEGITSFTVAPLKLATYLGLAVAVFAVAFGAQLILRTLLFGNPVAGYPEPDGGGAVPGGRAARHAGHHRRVSRPRVQRDQTAAALLRGTLLSQLAGWGR